MNDCLVTRYKDVSDDETLITLGNTKLHVVNRIPNAAGGLNVVVKNPNNFMRIFNSAVTFSDGTQRFDFTTNMDFKQAGKSLNAGEVDLEFPLYDLTTLKFDPTYGSGDGFTGQLSALSYAHSLHNLVIPYSKLLGNLEDIKDSALYYLNIYRPETIEGNIEILIPSFIRGYEYLVNISRTDVIGTINFGFSNYTGRIKVFFDSIAQGITGSWTIEITVFNSTVDITGVSGIDTTTNMPFRINFDGNGNWTVQS